MKYLIKFWDGHSIRVSKKVGEQIKIAKVNKIDCIKIGEAVYDIKAISYIEPIKEEPTNLLPEKTGNPVQKETLDRMKRQLSEKFNWK